MLSLERKSVEGAVGLARIHLAAKSVNLRCGPPGHLGDRARVLTGQTHYAQHHPSSDFRQLELYPFVKTEEEQTKQAYRTEQQVSSKLSFSERGDHNPIMQEALNHNPYY